MNTKKVIVFLLSISLVLSICGCSAIDNMKDMVTGGDNEEGQLEMVQSDTSEEDFQVVSEDNMRETVLYYKNASGYIVPVRRMIPWEEGIAKAALRNMIDSPVVREDIGAIGLVPTIPAGTEIIGMSINDETGLCKVNFSSEVLNYNTEDDELSLIESVVYTLTEFPAISKVQFMIDGKFNKKLKFGSDLSNIFNREDINLDETVSASGAKMVVYYKSTSNGEFEYYVPVTIQTSAPSANVLTALEKLFEGPSELSGLYTDIPVGVELQGVEISQGIAYVDLSQNASEIIQDQATYDMMSKNIALTLKQFGEIQNIEILIDGQTTEEAGMGFNSPEAMPVFANIY